MLVTAAVALLLLTPGNGLPDLPGPLPEWVMAFGDKIVHGVLFFIETLALHRALRHHYPRTARLWAVVLTATLSLFTELAQLAIPFRDGSLADLLADGVGIALALPLTLGGRGPGSTATITNLESDNAP